MIPDPVDYPIEPLSLGKMVRIASNPFEMAVAFCDALEEINGQEIAFGFYGGEGLSVSSSHVFSLITPPRRRRER